MTREVQSNQKGLLLRRPFKGSDKKIDPKHHSQWFVNRLKIEFDL